MTNPKRCELLGGLSGDGPMYVPVSYDDKEFYNEGTVVRFYKADGSIWIANFKSASSSPKAVFDFPKHDRIVVVAGGIGYVMSPESKTPITLFQDFVFEAPYADEDTLVYLTMDGICIMNVADMLPYATPWPAIIDEIKNVAVEDKVISGWVYTYDIDPDHWFWIDFSFNVDLREITGGILLVRERRDNALLNTQQISIAKSKPWWKFWLE